MIMLKNTKGCFFLVGDVWSFLPWVTLKSPFGRNLFATFCNHVKLCELNRKVIFLNFYIRFKFYIVYLAWQYSILPFFLCIYCPFIRECCTVYLVCLSGWTLNFPVPPPTASYGPVRTTGSTSSSSSSRRSGSGSSNSSSSSSRNKQQH